MHAIVPEISGPMVLTVGHKNVGLGVIRITSLPTDSPTRQNGKGAMGLGRLKKSKREAKLIAISWSLRRQRVVTEGQL